jgi:hypothetical protein
MFHTLFIDMFMVCVHTKFYMRSSSGSWGTPIKPKARSVILLFSTWYKNGIIQTPVFKCRVHFAGSCVRHIFIAGCRKLKRTRVMWVSIAQCFSTAGSRPGTGPWHQLYWVLVFWKTNLPGRGLAKVENHCNSITCYKFRENTAFCNSCNGSLSRMVIS